MRRTRDAQIITHNADVVTYSEDVSGFSMVTYPLKAIC